MTLSAVLRLAGFLLAMQVLFGFGHSQAAHATGSRSTGTVWLVFFSSKDCSHCASVGELIEALENDFPVRVKAFDIGREEDYALFTRLEAIHAQKRFSVPLILVGDSILMGEREIAGKLEPTVRQLVRSGGACLPYLGPRQRGEKPAGNRPSSRCDCEDRGRPPTIGEEWGKIRLLIDKLF
jgi:hypothetical protein